MLTRNGHVKPMESVVWKDESAVGQVCEAGSERLRELWKVVSQQQKNR